MSTRLFLVLAAPLSVVACDSPPEPSPALPKPAAMVVVPAGSASFRPVIPDRPDGPQMAVLWGDPATGPSAMLLRFARGPGSLHIHTADYHLIVLEGSMKHWAARESESTVPVLGPGSYWFQPGGVAHGDECVSDSCLMQIVWSGPRDGRLADSAAETTARPESAPAPSPP